MNAGGLDAAPPRAAERRARGRDRLEPTHDGTVVVLSPHEKPWTARPAPATRELPRPGTAVRWDEDLFEVIAAEPRAAGGVRYVLAPWDDRQMVRAVVDYGVETLAPARAEAPVGVAWWSGLAANRRLLAAGFVPGVLLFWLFPVRVMGEGMSALVHELGHTAIAWLFGCSAFPAVVLTVAFEQSRPAAAAIWAATAFFAWKYRAAPRWNLAFAAAAAVYPFVAFTHLHVTAFHLAGHLAELGLSAWALWHALRSDRPEWERCVWSFFGFSLAARNVRLFGGVAFDASARTDYLTVAIAGENDLVKVANESGLPLTTLCAVAALLYVAVPLAALVLALRRPRVEN